MYFKAEAAAKAAIDGFNGTSFKGVAIRVEAVRVRGPSVRPERRAGGGGGAGGAGAGARRRAGSGDAEERPARAPRAPRGPHTVYVGALARGTTSEEISAHFASAGHGDVQLLRGRGIAFISFADEGCVAHALGLDGSELNERNIKVEREKEKAPRVAGGGGDAAPRAPRERRERAPIVNDPSVVYVGNLGAGTSEEKLAKLFGKDVTRVEVAKNGTFA